MLSSSSHYIDVMLGKGGCHTPAACCRRMRKRIFNPFTLVVALALGLSCLAFSKLDQASEGSAKKNSTVQLNVDSKPMARQSPTVTSFAPVVKKVTPSVARTALPATCEAKLPGSYEMRTRSGW